MSSSIRFSPVHFHAAPAWLALWVLIGVAGCKPTAPAADTPATNAEPAAAPSALATAVDKLNPLPSDSDQVKAMMATFLTAKSYHATMTHSGGTRTMTNEIDFVAPDRYRMVMPMGTQYIIGDTMIMSIDGRNMKVPLPKGSMDFRDPARLSENAETMTVESLGSESLAGQATRKYLIRNSQPEPSESTMWVGANGYPQQIQVSSTAQGQSYTTTIRYSRFNDPTIRVDPPK